MDFNVSAEDEDFRQRLRRFLKDRSGGRPPRGEKARLKWQREWAAALYDAGWAAPGWPARWGGMDLPLSQQVVYHEEMARARAPAHPGTGVAIAGPTIIAHGGDEQRERYLRPMLRADEIWAQGFSEPGAGSDLPALRTTAERDGGVYVVNGQKVWSSSADIADILFTLVRTGSRDCGDRGISYLLIDARSPGVTIRPLRDLTGGTGFCEIFFDDVRVPLANRVGGEGQGWAIARTTLGHERSAAALSRANAYRRIVDELVDLARARGALDQPVLRRRLVDVEMGARLLRLNGVRAVSGIIGTGDPGPGSSTTRLFHAQFEQRLHEVAVDVLGPHGQLDRSDGDAVERGRWVWGFLRTRASTIGAGTAEIQRNTIAERVLGLPREPTT